MPFVYFMILIAHAFAGAVVGVLLGAAASIAVGWGRSEPDRIYRPCLVVGCSVGAIVGAVTFFFVLF